MRISDLFEIHEAFAAQVLATLKAWKDPDYNRKVLDRETPLGEIDPEKINVKGSSLAYGHPFAATGARILGMTAKMLNTEHKQRALISVCTAGAAWASLPSWNGGLSMADNVIKFRKIEKRPEPKKTRSAQAIGRPAQLAGLAALGRDRRGRCGVLPAAASRYPRRLTPSHCE